MRIIYSVLLAMALAGCGGSRYLHLRDGVALKCRHVEHSEDLGGYLVQLSDSGATILVDDERVRAADPVNGSPEGSRVIDAADPGDASTALGTAATELVTAMVDTLSLGVDANFVFLETENATPRRLSPTAVHEAAIASLEGRAQVVGGARRSSIIESIGVRASDTEMPSRAAELAAFYRADLVITTRVTGLRDADTEDSGYRYTLVLRAFDTGTGKQRWQGSRSWLVDW